MREFWIKNSILKRCNEIADRDGKDYSDLKAKCDRLEKALKSLADRHKWQPGLGECICPAHREAYEILNQTTNEK